jgi:hypothetical protein
VRLPRSYQPNDRQRRIAQTVPTRAEAGLPEDAFVFACFNNTYKIAPATFASWMRILRAVDGSVLWLLQDNAAAERNLGDAAEAAGVARTRLRFATRSGARRAPRAPRAGRSLPRHAALQRAHHASDALWAGLPVLSCAARTFPGRVGASLLRAVGTRGRAAGRDSRRVRVARHRARRDREALARIRATLTERRANAALFDIAGLCARLERAFEGMSDASDPKAPEASWRPLDGRTRLRTHRSSATGSGGREGHTVGAEHDAGDPAGIGAESFGEHRHVARARQRRREHQQHQREPIEGRAERHRRRARRRTRARVHDDLSGEKLRHVAAALRRPVCARSRKARTRQHRTEREERRTAMPPRASIFHRAQRRGGATATRSPTKGA